MSMQPVTLNWMSVIRAAIVACVYCIALPQPAYSQSVPVVIDNVRIEIGDGTVIDRGSVVFAHGQIQSVTVNTPIAPANAQFIDGTGKVVTPGLIESHSQLGLIEVDMEKSSVDASLSTSSMVPAFCSSDGYHADSVRIPIARAEGITAAVIAPLGRILYGTAAWAFLDQSPITPQPLPNIALMGGVGHAAAKAAGGARGGVWLKLRQAFADARFYQNHRALFARGEMYGLSLAPAHLEALLPIINGTRPWVVEANRASDIMQALVFAQQEHLRLIISGGKEAWRVAPALAQARVPVIVRPSMQSPDSFDALTARDDAATILHAAGVPLIISAAIGEDNTPRLRQEAGIAVAYGLPHSAALQAITQTPARIFGQDKATGTVQIGKRADLVLWSGDPLEVRSSAEAVWINGVAQPLITRQRVLAERYLAPPQ